MTGDTNFKAFHLFKYENVSTTLYTLRVSGNCKVSTITQSYTGQLLYGLAFHKDALGERT